MRDVIELSHKLYPDKAVVDVGVNVGQFLLELKAINGKAPYYGFEPNPACVFYVFELIRLNRFASTCIFPVAVADGDRISYLFSSAWDSGTSTLVKEFSKGREEFSTTVYSVNGDDIFDSIDEEISLIKIDVEGFEYNVLSGLAGTLEKYRPLVFCEINISLHESDNLKLMKSRLEDTHSLMKNLNYIPCGTGFSGERVVIDDVDAYSGLLSDYLFVPAEIMENVQEHFSNL
ncbi:MAG: FkbM family methyltransferase [Thiotrichales bacterium]|nr:MAG: FkbM family methyltransferase [Thiotrichales bacterium]